MYHKLTKSLFIPRGWLKLILPLNFPGDNSNWQAVHDVSQLGQGNECRRALTRQPWNKLSVGTFVYCCFQFDCLCMFFLYKHHLKGKSMVVSTDRC